MIVAFTKILSDRHPRVGGRPVTLIFSGVPDATQRSWVPASAGMTVLVIGTIA